MCIRGVCSNDLTALYNRQGPITASPMEIATPKEFDNQFTTLRTWTFIDAYENADSKD
ncbi:MAG: hypothetical protein QNL21_03610 [Flavobacteriales bacterium]